MIQNEKQNSDKRSFLSPDVLLKPSGPRFCLLTTCAAATLTPIPLYQGCHTQETEGNQEE